MGHSDMAWIVTQPGVFGLALGGDCDWVVDWVCAKFIGEKPAGYQPAARCSQNSSQRPLSWEQRRAIIALAWLTVQRIPDCFSRCPMIVLHPKCCRQHFGCNAGNIVTRSCAAELPAISIST